MARKPKFKGPSLRDKLGTNFLRDFEADFAANGKAVIGALRAESPAKYAEIASRLIATAEPEPEGGFAACKSTRDIARELLRQAGMPPDNITEEMIDLAWEANNRLMDSLATIVATNGGTDECDGIRQ
jgi:hypothetical protein